MLPIFNTFNKKLLDKEVEPLDITSIQTSVITKYYPELGSTKNWDASVQSATPVDKNDPSKGFIILDRTFQDLEFDLNAYDFDYIKGTNPSDPFYTPTNIENEQLKRNPSYLSKTNYWLVVQCLKVKEWFSNNSKELEDFRCWEYKEHIFQQEIYFKHKLIHSYIKDRPTSPGITSPGLTPNSPNVCDVGQGETAGEFLEGTQITTGMSPTFKSEGGACLRWDSLNIPYIEVVDCKKALGAVVKVNDNSLNVKVYIKPTANSIEKVEVGMGSFEDPIQLTQQFLEVVITNPGKNTFKRLQVDFYGEEYYRLQIPFKWDEEVEYQMHDSETLINTNKYHPPRKLKPNGEWTTPLFDTNFRLNKEFTSITNFRNRMSQEF